MTWEEVSREFDGRYQGKHPLKIARMALEIIELRKQRDELLDIMNKREELLMKCPACNNMKSHVHCVSDKIATYDEVIKACRGTMMDDAGIRAISKLTAKLAAANVVVQAAKEYVDSNEAAYAKTPQEILDQLYELIAPVWPDGEERYEALVLAVHTFTRKNA